MAHDDRRRRERARQLDDIGELRMIEPGVERQAASGEPAEAGTEIRPLVEMRLHVGAAVADRVALVPAGRMAHPAKAAAAGADVHFEHRLDPLAQGQVGKADDAGGDPGLAVAAAGAHRREPGDEFGLADRAQFGRAVGAVHRAAFEKHGRFDVVTGIDVGEQLVEQIAMAGTFGRRSQK